MKDFHKYEVCITTVSVIRYWKGEKIPKCLTLFVGGNHEAPGHLREMYFGGYAAKDIFYLGNSGVFHVGGLRIVGVSGIYKGHDYDKPIFEAPPYTEQTKRSAYHVRRFDIEKLMLISGPVDVVVSHDWPCGITNFGDTETLLRVKDRTGQLRQEIETNSLGNPHTMRLLKKLKPRYWFSGHMHVKYAALYEHEDGSVTRFLALDKCIPRRPFLQMVKSEVNVVKTGTVCLDPEWLAILKVNNECMPVGGAARNPTSLKAPSPSEIEDTITYLRSNRTVVPAPVEVAPGMFEFPYLGQIHPGNGKYREWLCAAIGMTDKLSSLSVRSHEANYAAPPPVSAAVSSVLSADALFFEDSY